MKQPSFFLTHILSAIAEIESYVGDKDEVSFVADSMCYNATIRQIEVIGEAISRLETDFLENYPEIPWKDIKAMRNILIHEYWQTDVGEVYRTVKNDLPILKNLIAPILENLTDNLNQDK